MYSCRQASKLMSLARDQPLSFVQRLMLRAHLGMCDGCRTFKRQLDLLKEVARAVPDESEKGATE